MLPLRLFRSRTFSAANAVSLLMYFGMFGSIFLLAQFFQVVQHYSPFQAGLRTLPWTIMPIFVAPIAGLLSTRTGTRPLIVAGMVLQAAALAWLSAVVTPTVDYLVIVPAFILAGIGMGLFFAPIANVVLSAVRPEEEGKASGANNAIREIGGVFGVAVLASIFAANGSYAHRPGVRRRDAARAAGRRRRRRGRRGRRAGDRVPCPLDGRGHVTGPRRWRPGARRRGGVTPPLFHSSPVGLAPAGLVRIQRPRARAPDARLLSASGTCNERTVRVSWLAATNLQAWFARRASPCGSGAVGPPTRPTRRFEGPSRRWNGGWRSYATRVPTKRSILSPCLPAPLISIVTVFVFPAPRSLTAPVPIPMSLVERKIPALTVKL